MVKTNGSGRHEDPDDKLIRFPTLAERDRLRREKREREEAEDRPRRKSVPFFNFSRIPPFTRAMVIAFVAVHIFLHFFVNEETLGTLVYTFGFVPGNFTGVTGEFPYMTPLTPVTYLFIHGGWTHLIFNSLMMFAMGTFFEREFGARKTAFMFFACGLAGAAAFFAFSPFSPDPIIGASGAITGLFGAVTILIYQRDATIGRFGGRLANKGPWPLVGFWLIFMVVTGLLSGDALAWQAHVGGFLAGIALLYWMQRGKPTRSAPRWH